MANKDRILLATQKKKNNDNISEGKEIGTELAADGNQSVSDAGAKLLATSQEIDTAIADRALLQDQVNALTGTLKKLKKEWNLIRTFTLCDFVIRACTVI